MADPFRKPRAPACAAGPHTRRELWRARWAMRRERDAALARAALERFAYVAFPALLLVACLCFLGAIVAALFGAERLCLTLMAGYVIGAPLSDVASRRLTDG